MAGSTHTKADFNVYLDGTKVDGATKAAISGVRVFLTHRGASAFEIVVDDPELRWQDKPTFTECKEVKIELGIPGKMKKVFDGEVTAWRTELERAGPTVLVLRGLDRSHRLMRGHKTKTYAQASPIDCAQQIASATGLTAKTSAGQPAPVKIFRMQSNESDFTFLRKMADLEGYLFYVDGSDLHFERPKISSNDDLTVTYGEELKSFLPVANFRRPASKVEAFAWDSAGKAALTGKAKPGDELWSVPGGKPGADVSTFQGTKANLGIVESHVVTQEHADTVARAALTRRSLEFLTAEVEVQGNPEIKPGALVNVKKVGVYSGHYLVTEANHFFDAAGYSCIFYVARDKWGDSSTDAEKKRKSDGEKGAQERAERPYQPPKPPPEKAPADDTIDFTLEGDDGKPLANVKCKVKLKSGELIEATTDADGHVHIDRKPEGPYTVEVTGDALELTTIDLAVEDAGGGPVVGATGKVKFSDGSELAVATDAEGKIHLEDVPAGEYTLTFDASPSGGDAPEGEGRGDGGGGSAASGGQDAAAAEPGAKGEGGSAASGGEAAPAGGSVAEGEAAPAGGSAGDAEAGPAGGGAAGGETAPEEGGTASGDAAPSSGEAAVGEAAPAAGGAATGEPAPPGASAGADAGSGDATGGGAAGPGAAPAAAAGGGGAAPQATATPAPGSAPSGGAAGSAPGQGASPAAAAGKPGATATGGAAAGAPSSGAALSVGGTAKPVGPGTGGTGPDQGTSSATADGKASGAALAGGPAAKPDATAAGAAVKPGAATSGAGLAAGAAPGSGGASGGAAGAAPASGGA
ncbi:MAG TPA: hypothetical protein VE964_02330, partial [Myxococcales bacterium]|nr:hypothetical protein [Myxococcales bacterium]